MKKLLSIIVLVILGLTACEQSIDNGGLDTVHGEIIEITIESLTIEYGGVFAEAPEGEEYLVIEMIVTNNDTVDRTINAALMFELFGDVGGTYPYDAFVLSETSLQSVDGTLEPGESKHGNVPFAVMESDSEWELKFTPDVYSGRTYSIEFDRNDLE